MRALRPLGAWRVAILAAVALVLVVSAASATQTRRTAAPANAALPTISGVATAGQTLTATPGTWTGTTPITFVFSWLRCNALGVACVQLGRAGNTATYTLGSVDVGTTLRVSVKGTNAEGAAAATSAQTGVIQAAPVGAPANTAPPTITGTASTGSTLTAVPGTWSGNEPITFTQQWSLCDVNGAGCQAIPGATATTYVIPATDAGMTLRVSVTGKNAAGSAASDSVPTAKIGNGPTGLIDVTGGQSIPITSVELPAQLTIDKVVSSPAVLSSRSAFQFTVTVKDSRGFFVRGALVSILGVPYSRVGTVPEKPTLTNGSFTFTVHPLPGLELGRGKYLVFFVKARAPTDTVLTGVTARRLVQVRTGPPA